MIMASYDGIVVLLPLLLLLLVLLLLLLHLMLALTLRVGISTWLVAYLPIATLSQT